MRTVVVIPTYNEAANLEALARHILRLPGFSLIVVDDNSPDGTGAIADELANRYIGRVSVIHRADKQGLGTAYVEGFRQALAGGYDFIAQMDADFSHNPADLPRLVAAASAADVAIGSRYVRGGGAENWPLFRWLISRGGSLYTRLVLGLPMQDPTSGFKCFRRDALGQIDPRQICAKGFGFQVEMNWRCHRQGLRVVEIPIRFIDRKLGHSKMSTRIFLEALWLVWQLRLRGTQYGKHPNYTAS